MSEPYKSPFPLPTPYERELLTILAEELFEAGQRVTKLLRFGRDECEPGQELTNRERLTYELGHVLAMIRMCQDLDLVGPDFHLRTHAAAKIDKVHLFLQETP